MQWLRSTISYLVHLAYYAFPFSMKKFVHCLLAFSLLVPLASCTTKNQLTLEQSLKNPLFAERYGNEMTDRMTELEIQHDPLLKEGRKGKYAMDAKEQALTLGDAATKKRHEGTYGSFVTVKEETDGSVLFVDSMLYLSPNFATYPGPSLHLFITTIVDPRNVQFPDGTAIDLGRLESPYGAGQYAVPKNAKQGAYRTVVLWDTRLERVYSFAQLSR